MSEYREREKSGRRRRSALKKREWFISFRNFGSCCESPKEGKDGQAGRCEKGRTEGRGRSGKTGRGEEKPGNITEGNWDRGAQKSDSLKKKMKTRYWPEDVKGVSSIRIFHLFVSSKLL